VVRVEPQLDWAQIQHAPLGPQKLWINPSETTIYVSATHSLLKINGTTGEGVTLISLDTALGIEGLWVDNAETKGWISDGGLYSNRTDSVLDVFNPNNGTYTGQYPVGGASLWVNSGSSTAYFVCNGTQICKSDLLNNGAITRYSPNAQTIDIGSIWVNSAETKIYFTDDSNVAIFTPATSSVQRYSCDLNLFLHFEYIWVNPSETRAYLGSLSPLIYVMDLSTAKCSMYSIFDAGSPFLLNDFFFRKEDSPYVALWDYSTDGLGTGIYKFNLTSSCSTPGYGFNSATFQCDLCQPGYATLVNLSCSSCLPCASGYYSKTNGTVGTYDGFLDRPLCTYCPSGTGGEEGATECSTAAKIAFTWNIYVVIFIFLGFIRND